MLLKTNLAQDQFASFTNSNGVLTITFGADATSALISDVINHIQYQNDKPTGDTTIRFTLNDGSGGSTTADVKVESDTIYVTNSTDTATIDVSNGVSFSEAVAIANADTTGSQTLVLVSNPNNDITTNTVTFTEDLTIDARLLTNPTILTSGGEFAIRNSSNLTIINNASQSLEIAGVNIQGNGSFIKTGEGTLILSVGSDLSGAITVNAGTLQIGDYSHLGSGDVILESNSTLKITNQTTIPNNFLLTGDATIQVDSNVAISGNFAGTNTLTKSGTGNLILSSTNNSANFSGDIIVSAGTLSVGKVENLNANTGKITLESNTTLKLTNQIDVQNGIVLNGNPIIQTDADATISGGLFGNFAFTKKGVSTLTLSATNSSNFTGVTTVMEGTLAVASDANLGSKNINFSPNTTLRITGETNIDNDLWIDDHTTIETTDNVTLSGSINNESDISSLLKSGTGTLTLSGTNGYNGTTIIDQGTLKVASDANLGTDYVQIGGINHSSLEITESGEFDNVIMIADNGDNSSYGTIIINENQTVTLNGKLDEPTDKANDLYKSGKGILVLASPDNELGLLGDIFVQEGDVQVADDDSLPNGDIIFDSNGDELDINPISNTLINNNFSINDNANFNTADGKTITISGEIKGENDSKDFTKKGSGNLNLTGSSSFAGETKITAGLLSVNGSLLNTKDVAVSSGATLGGSGTIGSEGKGAVTISEGGKLAPGNSPGKMTLNNGLTLNAGSTLEIQINNDTVNTGYDQVDVKGFVYLSNSILAITPNANLEIEKSFTIINNDGIDAVVGTFKDASEGTLN